ncbi:MAG: hypothetical protein U9Q66_01580 [Patescibacteria group bacterium]|nr:hypothetical protein [Patescibacteria group bacterium]
MTNIDENNAFENARKQMKKACELFRSCRHDDNKFELISHPKRILEVNIPVRMDN